MSIEPNSATSDPELGASHTMDIVTCEYPPAIGGVADYTEKVAAKLKERGQPVRVWAPRGGKHGDVESTAQVIRSFTNFSLRDLLTSDRLMGPAKRQMLLLQWEPVGFGLQSFNLPFCLWIASRVVRGTKLLVMFHETFLPFNKRTVKRYLGGTFQRLMAAVLVNSARVVFVSNGSGAEALRPFCFQPSKILHLPVFSNVETAGSTTPDLSSLRDQFAAPEQILIGHFGRYMANTEPLVLPALAALLLRQATARVLFIGECGETYRTNLLRLHPDLASRVHAPGVGAAEEIGALISICDLMYQPYPGGITTKRSSTMASLAYGRCVLSNRGEETEALWNNCPGVQMIDRLDPVTAAECLEQLAADRSQLNHSQKEGAAFYRDHFSLDHTVDAILSSLGESKSRVSEPLISR